MIEQACQSCVCVCASRVGRGGFRKEEMESTQRTDRLYCFAQNIRERDGARRCRRDEGRIRKLARVFGDDELELVRMSNGQSDTSCIAFDLVASKAEGERDTRA